MPEFGSWRPIHDTHAIEVAAISISFNEPVGDVIWRRAQALLEPIIEKYQLSEQGPVGFAVPQELRALGIANLVPQGTAYARLDHSGAVSERLQITRNSIKIEDYSYIRWAPFREQFKDLCAEIVTLYSNSSSIASIQSEYLDSFESLVSADASKSTEVIDEESSLVSKAAIRDTDNWHCHCGWFDRYEKYRRLINVNIDVADRTELTELPKATRLVRIRTMASDQFGALAGFEHEDTPFEWKRLAHHLDSEHNQLKDLLRTTLTKRALEAISL